jgi:FkbM family methyltransferase
MRNGQTRALMFTECELLLRLKYPAGDNHTLVDVGAQAGGFAQPFAKRGWRVIALEPEPSNYQELSERFKNFPNVTCIAKAVSQNSEQGVPFYVSSEHWGIHSLKPFHPTHQSRLTVDTVRLSAILTEMQVDWVTVLKIDIEGADFLALQSFDFKKMQPEVVMCEFMDERSQKNFGYTHHDMVVYMDNWGYFTFVSEWAPIVEYGRRGMPVSHRFLQCVPYPLDHEPAWGNLFFVPRGRAAEFRGVLSSYLGDLELSRKMAGLRSLMGKLPGGMALYHALHRIYKSLLNWS